LPTIASIATARIVAHAKPTRASSRLELPPTPVLAPLVRGHQAGDLIYPPYIWRRL